MKATLIQLCIAVSFISINLYSLYFSPPASDCRCGGNPFADIAGIDSALDAYKMDTGRYPHVNPGLATLQSNLEGAEGWNGPYLKGGLPKDPWGNDYRYFLSILNSSEYHLYSRGPDGVDESADDVSTAL